VTAFKIHTFFLNYLLCIAAFTRKERCIKHAVCRPFFYSPFESYVRQTELKFCVSNCHICARSKPSVPEGVVDIFDRVVSFNFGQSLLPLSTYRTGDCVVLTHCQRSNPSHYAFVPPFSSSFQTQLEGVCKILLILRKVALQFLSQKLYGKLLNCLSPLQYVLYK